jgi:hypothetical protein
MRKIIVFLLLLQISVAIGQVDFSAGTMLIDDTHLSHDITAIFSTDLNNDGQNELLVASRYDNAVLLYKNIGGNVQQNQRILLASNPDANFDTFHDVYATDLDGDGLNDIIITSGFEDTIYWIKNLGNYNFSSPNLISSAVNDPKSVAAGDVDNDGDNDIVVALAAGENITLFVNNGSGIFNAPQIVQTSDDDASKVKLFDLDNNGYLDIISGWQNGIINWNKNIAGVFNPSIAVTTGAGNGTGFDFIKINNDNYYDIVFCSNNSTVKSRLNQGGNTFSTSQATIGTAPFSPLYLLAKDMNGDGISDIVFSTNDAIAWYQNNNGVFSAINEISSNVTNPAVFIVDDFDSDGRKEVVSASYASNNVSQEKLTMFEHDTALGTSVETVINFYFSAVNTVKIADLNNDGNNDIVCGFRGIVWNENIGDGDFTSQKLLSSNVSTVSFYFDLELIDLNNDNYKDIATVTNLGLEVYKNKGDESFEMMFSMPMSTPSRDIELTDIDGDGDSDILMTDTSGNLYKVINNDNFGFGAMEPIDFTTYGYQPNRIKCADIDNDGDNDIVVSSSEYSRIHLLKNNGSGTFSLQLVTDSVSSNVLELADIDNDNFVDIISGGNYSYSASSVYWIKNNGGITFGASTIIDYQTVKAITVADLNNDGLPDLVGASYQYYAPYDEKVFYYLNTGGSMGPKHIIESLGDAVSMERSLAAGDLNNDNKADIVSGYYYIRKVKYFMNTSQLSTPQFDPAGTFALYPNPATNEIHWNSMLTKVGIYTLTGQLVLNQNVGGSQTIDISCLQPGVYIFRGVSVDGICTGKIVKE